jgi:predicted extracellular nuclease
VGCIAAGIVVSLIGASGVAAQTVALSEIRIDQPSTDNDEYFELSGSAGTSLTGMTYLVIGDGTGGSGVIEAVVDLTSQSIPGSGFFVAAESTFTLGTADLTTTLNFENSDNVTHLLVDGFVGSNGDDLDTDDDGTLDSTPWSSIVDCVGLVETVGSGDRIYCATTVGPDGSFVPGHVYFCPDAWRIGAFGGGEDTAGAANPCAPPAADPVINEFVFNHTGTDTHEFVEVFGDPNTDYSAFTVLEIEGDSSGAGVIDGVFAVGTTSFTGFWFSGFFGNVIENGTVTLLLVDNFTGSAGTDLDVDNDGALDSAPWDRVVDSVAVHDGGSSDRTYGVTLFRSFDGISFTVGGASRIPNGTDTETDADWVRNDFDGAGLPGFTGALDLGEAVNTPEVRNKLASFLVINEIDYDQPGTDAAEFIELKNVSSSPVDLTDVEIRLVNGTGGGAAIYNTVTLPSVTLGAGDYYVVCANAATVLNCDLDASPDTNFIQNGAPDAVALAKNGTILDTVSYEGDTGAPYTEGSGSGLADGSADFTGISRLPDGLDTDQNNVDLDSSCITPGLPNTALLQSCGQLGATFEIFEIQGSGASSPFDGAVVTTLDNAVTAVGTNGFFIQTPAARSDGDIDTSDGIFVFTGSAPGVSVGDSVDVFGEIDEFFGLTEFSNNPIVIVDGTQTVPAPVTFDATVPSPDPTAPSCAIEFECYEDMLVTIADGTVTGPNQRFGSDPIAEVHITAAPVRTFREPGIEFPGLSGLPVWDGNPEVFELDPDRLGLSNMIIPAGSSFSATGVLGFEFGGYELWPTSLTVTSATIPVPVRPRDPGEFTVGSLNLFRLFDDFDDPPDMNFMGQTRDDDVRSTTEYQRRLGKFSAYIREVLDAPDILAVQEAEKLGVLEDLAARILADSLGAPIVYSAYLEEGNDQGTIDVGFLVRDTVKVDSVTQLGLTEVYFNPVTMGSDILHDRPPLLLEGRFPAGAVDTDDDDTIFKIQVIGVHNRSLGGIDDPFDGPRVRAKRLAQAQSIAEKIDDLQGKKGNKRVMVIGDFNAFEFTDGYVDALGQVEGDFDPADNLLAGTDLVDPDLINVVDTIVPVEERYSFIFRGSAQVLDHALLSGKTEQFVTGAEFGRGNADAAVDLINDGGTALRASDHDGLVVYIHGNPDPFEEITLMEPPLVRRMEPLIRRMERP